MKKWEMKYHKSLGVGVIVKNVFKQSEQVTMNFDNKTVDPISVKKSDLSDLLIKQANKVEMPTLF